jgi:uncharacterized protein HemY
MESSAIALQQTITESSTTVVAVATIIVLVFYIISLYIQYRILMRAVRIGNEQAFQNRTKK